MKTAKAVSTSPVSRRGFMKTVAGAAGAAALAPVCRTAAAIAPAGPRPNIFFLNVDQLSCDSIGHHGCGQVKTPNIDRLARRSVSFTQSYSVNPLCIPARAGWFTGRMSTENGVDASPLQASIPTLGCWLRDQGYQTFHAGKLHLGPPVNGGLTELSPDPKNTASLGDIVTTRSVEGFFRNYKDRAPFFLGVGLLNPHDICSFNLTNALFEGVLPFPELAGQLPPPPPNFNAIRQEPRMVEVLRETLLGTRVKSEEFNSQSWKEDFWRYYLWAYYRYIEMVDGQVGLILDALEDSGLAGNTVVIFSSDHGDGHTAHQLLYKGFLYDEAARVPLMMSWPGHLPENVIDNTHLVSGADLFPTVCDYASVKPPPKMRGYSVRGPAEGRTRTWRDFVVAHTYDLRGKMLRSNDYKLIAYAKDPAIQLFDMKNDPGETRNLADQSGLASVVKDHQKMLSDFEATLDMAPSVKAGLIKRRILKRE